MRFVGMVPGVDGAAEAEALRRAAPAAAAARDTGGDGW